MNIADIIKEARERLGMTQEDLAEKLEVSRQAVSKWEVGASVPSPENLKILEKVLGVCFPTAEGTIPEVPQAVPKAAFWTWKKVVLLVLGVLALLSLLSTGMFMALRTTHTDVPRLKDPYITSVAFFDEAASPLQPDLGDGWNSFAAGSRVLMAVEFQDGWNADLNTPTSVDAVSLFLTLTGTETFDQRVQLAVQAVPDGRHFALFALDIPEGMMGHLDIVLESGGVQTVAETLKVTADPDSAPVPAFTIPGEAVLVMEGTYLILKAQGAPSEEIVWTSSDPGVVEVTDIGAVFPVSPGNATVTAAWNGQTAECLVHVYTKPEPTDIPGVSVSR